jgi:hypothetical protein
MKEADMSTLILKEKGLANFASPRVFCLTVAKEIRG